MRGYILMEITGDSQRLARGREFVTRGFKTDALKPIVAKTFRFEEIVDAHRFLESNEQIGKIVVIV